MKSLTPIVAGSALIILTGILVWYQTSRQMPLPASKTSSTQVANITTSYSVADITKHGDAKSCWTSISGNVYDLTEWISKHPGGKGAIQMICGKDGSNAFNAQHGGAALQQQILKSYQIGVVGQ